MNDFGKKTNIDVNLTHTNLKLNLPGDVNITVYRIIQEALTNIARYAEVKEAAVTLKLEGQVLSIRIEDKGKGLPWNPSRRGLV